MAWTSSKRAFTEASAGKSLEIKEAFRANDGKLSPHALDHPYNSLLALIESAARSPRLVEICAWMDTVSPACHSANIHSLLLASNASNMAKYHP